MNLNLHVMPLGTM